MQFMTRFCALLGFLISAYAYYVGIKINRLKAYRPLCDIHIKVSCSKAFTSKFGHIFGIPNPLIGLVFYAFFLMVSFYDTGILFYLAMPAFLFSLYLAFISYFIQKNFCMVCTLIYIINTGLLVFGYLGKN